MKRFVHSIRLIHCLVCLVAVMALFFSGCAAQQAQRPQPPAGCDPAIDVAVKSGDWEKARADHAQLLSKTPDDCLARYHLGYIWGRLGDRAKEIDSYEKALACGYRQDDQLYFNLGMARADRGDLRGARDAFEKAVAVNPTNADNYFGMGLMYEASGRLEQAVAAWLKAVSLNGDHIEAHLALARHYLEIGRWSRADDHLKAVLDIEPANEEALALRRVLRSRRAIEY